MTDDKEKIIVQKIKNGYEVQEQSKLQKLKALDKKVKIPVKVFAYTIGTIGTLILGIGMCLAMKVIGSSITALMPVGIVVGLLGIIMVSASYSIYKKILDKRKAEYSKEIITMSDELLNNKGE